MFDMEDRDLMVFVAGMKDELAKEGIEVKGLVTIGEIRTRFPRMGLFTELMNKEMNANPDSDSDVIALTASIEEAIEMLEMADTSDKIVESAEAVFRRVMDAACTAVRIRYGEEQANQARAGFEEAMRGEYVTTIRPAIERVASNILAKTA